MLDWLNGRAFKGVQRENYLETIREEEELW